MGTQRNVEIDQARSEEFAERMLAIVNAGALNLMISIGHRTGLFDGMSGLDHATSAQIAGGTGLNERYVREWLGAMTTGGIVEHDPEAGTYHLPAEHAAWLTRAATPNNLGVETQWLAVLASVEDKILGCFASGGGLAYEDYHRFHEVMAEESQNTIVTPLVDTLLPLVPGLPEALERGIRVLDVGCGSGFALIEMARTFPESRFTGYDLCPDAVERGVENARALGLANIELVVRDVAAMDDDAAFDLITTFDAVHDQASPDTVLSNIARALAPDGVYFMQDIAGSSHVYKNMDHPIGPFLYTISCLHCMSVSLGQGGRGLGAMWGRELACEMLAEAGFGSVDVRELPHDPINYYYIVRK